MIYLTKRYFVIDQKKNYSDFNRKISNSLFEINFRTFKRWSFAAFRTEKSARPGVSSEFLLINLPWLALKSFMVLEKCALPGSNSFNVLELHWNRFGSSSCLFKDHQTTLYIRSILTILARFAKLTGIFST